VIDTRTLRTLASRQCHPAVVSMILDVDGRRYPRPSDYVPNVERLFRRARDDATRFGRRGEVAVAADLGRIARWLAGGIDRTRTRGVAFYSASEEDLFWAVTLPIALRDQVVVDVVPDVAPLVAAEAGVEPALVVALDSERSRLVWVEPGRVSELDAPIDHGERRVDTDVELGSFSRRHEEAVRRHFRHVASAVATELDARPSGHLVLDGAPAAVASFEGQLPERARELVAGHLSLPVTTPASELSRAATEVVGEAERRHRDAVLETLRGRVAEGADAVAGLDATLAALGDDRLGVVAFETGFAAPGGRCSACGALAIATEGACPRCGAALHPVPNVVDAAVTVAFARRVALEACEPGTLADLGGIGGIGEASAARAQGTGRIHA
jgi:hypothetical protein